MTTLNDLIDQLTRDQQTPVHELDGITCLRPDPPLLTALANARTANIGQGNGIRAAHERSNLNAGASELYATINRRIRRWAILENVPQHWAQGPLAADWRDPAALLRAWHAKTLSNPRFDPSYYIETIDGWIRAIRDMVTDPPRKDVIEAPCPLCNQSWVAPEGFDELAVRTLERAIRTPTERSTITCRHCHKIWAGIDGARQLRIAIDDAAATHQVAS